MKRVALHRRKPLAQGKPLRRTRPLARHARLRAAVTTSPVDEAARESFKRVRDGICRVCGKRGLVRRHHIVTEQHLRLIEGADLWSLANGLWVGVGSEAGMLRTCDCHERHTNASHRIPVSVLPVAAVQFMVTLLGTDAAAAYLARFYG